MSEKRWVTFDCFGTLVDWRHGIATGIELVAPGKGWELLDVYNRHEPQVQSEYPAMRYSDVLAEALKRTAAEAKLDLVEDQFRVLTAGIPFWPVFPETRQALLELQGAGWNLALLTNCDRVVIGETQRRLGIQFDAIVTAEDSGAYKPALNHFQYFEKSLGVTRDRWVHVAQSYFHDMVPAGRLDITRVWINRLDEKDDPSIAHAVRRDLSDLAATVNEVHQKFNG
ncbi:HAD family hydrolase [Streptomyces sp. NBC_00878]|uniref:HAD family hydrolase n=1 Tax=Streptomyces sp. NBC_00878 TaxID=2975854 RepID=UPI00225209DE|nr:HAD family hydrolase [Streptomyces sp. NBC_00878]MCX4907434.1 HAD family hydrolase [Streptomyces sp. NBC_00878]